MPAQRKYPPELIERAVRMVAERQRENWRTKRSPTVPVGQPVHLLHECRAGTPAVEAAEPANP
jgi:hypothetical protein